MVSPKRTLVAGKSPSEFFVDVDPVNGALIIGHAIERRTQRGELWHVSYFEAAIADDANLDVDINTGPDRELHIRFAMVATGECRIRLFEGATVNSFGPDMLVTNRNRRSNKVPEATFHTGSSIGATGDLIIDELLSGSTGPGPSTSGGSSGIGNFSVFILAPSTSYLFRLTNISGSAVDIAPFMIFYEHALG